MYFKYNEKRTLTDSFFFEINVILCGPRFVYLSGKL